ncbi:MAG: magnesium chelatase family protein [Parcubacteria group bacterium Gr01-1014_107]|nr:MAG: magnesium chelatase family protein [Parcubacteria group bacterium Gr01-1014_107]
MSFAKVFSAQNVLLEAKIISIELDLSRGLNAFAIVGLPDKAVEESKDRVSAAIKNIGFSSPKTKNQKVVVSLAPADLKKEGPVFDLAIALGYLLSAKEIKFKAERKLFLGELSLDGELRPLRGILPLVSEAKKRGFEEIYLPSENAEEAALIEGLKVFGVKNLKQVITHLNEKKTDRLEEDSSIVKLEPQKRTEVDYTERPYEIDFADVRGQESAKRGLEIAAAGGHNVAMFGPPGTGKSMLAKAFTYLLPPLSFEEILEITSIHSIAGALKETLVVYPPFRSPHHTSSYVSLVGGGTNLKPGEITLAHKGVLFLDEFPEFDKRVVESLRQPLEDRVINVARAKASASFPADFILIAAMNPCPCGNFGVKGKECLCLPGIIQRYQRKISGPMIDRIDLWLEVSKVDYEKLSEKGKESETDKIKERVSEARDIQRKRYQSLGLKIKTNSALSAKELGKLIVLKEALKNKFNEMARRLDLSARSYHRVLKIGRTIADLENSEEIEEPHLLEALQYRPKKIEFV